MSCIAFTTTKQQIVLLSDGRQANEKTPDKVSSMGSRKVWKLTGDIGLFWLGYYPYKGVKDEMINVLDDCRTPEAVAGRVSDFLDVIFTGSRRQKLKGADRLRACAIVVGYASRKPQVWQVDSEEDFAPKRVPCNAGQSGLMGYDAETSKAAARYEQLAGKYLSFQLPLEKACRQAFTDVVEGMAAKGKPVGGKIFCEVLRPAKQTKFRQALMN